MESALHTLTRIPGDDLAALRKMRGGTLPPPQPLVRPALVIVDMVEAFVRDEYPTGWAATGEPCAAVIARIRTAARAHGVPVIYTVSEPLSHPALVGRWRRGEETAVAPFALTAAAHRIVPELAPDDDDIVLVKAKPSAFYGTQLAGVLNALRTESVIVTGMTTSGCVRGTVLDAFNLNFAPVIPLDGVADRAALSHEVNLFDMGAKYGDVVTSDDLIVEIERLPR